VRETDTAVGSIDVDVADGIATLNGIVKSQMQRQMAEADAWYVFRVDLAVNLLNTED